MPNEYTTSDLHVAMTLHALGFKLVGIDRTDYRRSLFKYHYDAKIPQAIEAFFRDELTINPRLLLLSAKLVKDRLHSGT
jgi:hypothetical protein